MKNTNTKEINDKEIISSEDINNMTAEEWFEYVGTL